ncbi:lipopolysaccharide biosynthesis protein [Alteromonas mediterranea]|uniref:Lipopolysaccharide biosynthesis protein n=1 Tax=Alteromonas mediterranea TaxID=314275 RepID=A0AAC9JCN5_9ALTE|nr:O-antigen translocase [Alteromonas mediterranea]APD91164.1 lipopolysaccharide biosynthesis protein [Alteromonas mediterranea]APE03256.1 lipopolysaccharide biosynthesis protein [Alteromonas mediterranea]
MTLIKTSFLSLIATIIKLISGLIINKAVAIFIGPSGLAMIGQFQNFIQITLTLAQGAINTGVTKYSAENGKDSSTLPVLVSTATKISVTCSALVGCLVILFADVLSLKIFNSLEFESVFIVFGITVVLYVLNSLLLSFLNGLKEIKAFISINIAQSFYSLIFTTLLVIFFGLKGALFALVTNQSIVFITSLIYLKKKYGISFDVFKSKFDKKVAKKLSNFSLMALVSAVCVPGSHMIIRDFIADELTIEAAGYWQAMWYISSMYLMVITTALGTYYLPRLSEIKSRSELSAELFNGYKIILPIVSSLAFLIYLLKDIIILVLFTPKFEAMRELFAWQLLGDVLKIASWLVAYLLLAKAKTFIYVSTEIIFSISFVCLSFFFVSEYGTVGMTYSYSLNYLFYLIAISLVVRKVFFTGPQNNELLKGHHKK